MNFMQIKDALWINPKTYIGGHQASHFCLSDIQDRFHLPSWPPCSRDIARLKRQIWRERLHWWFSLPYLLQPDESQYVDHLICQLTRSLDDAYTFQIYSAISIQAGAPLFRLRLPSGLLKCGNWGVGHEF